MSQGRRLYNTGVQSLENQAKKLFKKPGVYIFRDAKEVVVYVGKSINVQDRIHSHLRATGEKSKSMVAAASTVSAIPVGSELEALLLEAELIKKYLPHYNVSAKDDKHPLYIKITREEFPKITTSRKDAGGKAYYFGPFPSSTTVKQVLKNIRRIFPFCAQPRIGKKGCFYSHIGLCNPCPNEISKIADPALKLKLSTEYKSNLRRILLLLSGKTKMLQKKLTQEMNHAAQKQDYEKAGQFRDQLDKLEYITRPYHKTSEYLKNPNFLTDLHEQEMLSLYNNLKPYLPNVTPPRRIECFDVAHTGGTQTTCSLVTFIDGESEKSLYRKFKIKSPKKSDDYASLREALERRLKHAADWGIPDLIVIDGGKGQVGTALAVLTENNVDIPLIGLAKRYEEIVIPTKNGFKVLLLGHANPGVKLLQRLRDEAHRFARSYHFKLRMKELLPRALRG